MHLYFINNFHFQNGFRLVTINISLLVSIFIISFYLKLTYFVGIGFSIQVL